MFLLIGKNEKFLKFKKNFVTMLKIFKSKCPAQNGYSYLCPIPQEKCPGPENCEIYERLSDRFKRYIQAIEKEETEKILKEIGL